MQNHLTKWFQAHTTLTRKTWFEEQEVRIDLYLFSMSKFWEVTRNLSHRICQLKDQFDQIKMLLKISKYESIRDVCRAGESASAWQRGWEPSKGPEIQSRSVNAKLESNSEPERARVCWRVAVRARGSQSGSHRKPYRARERLASHF